MKVPLFAYLVLTMGLTACPEAKAAITLSIDEFTTTTFTFSISGTLAVNADTPEGPAIPLNLPSLFAVTLNQHASIPFFTGTPVKTSGDILMSTNPNQELASSSNSGVYYLSFSYDSTFPIYAGTPFSGSVTFTGDFNPAAANPWDFQLWSGFQQIDTGFHVFHTNAVPEPSAMILAGGTAAAGLRRRRV